MTDSSLTRKLRSSCVQIVQLVFLLAVLTLGPAVAQAQTAAKPPASPSPSASSSSDQPIAYSHQLHAGELQIQCTYCHSGARRSQAATVPAVSVCTGCHRWVKNKTPEMKKIDDYAAKKQPILWKRINQMDDHVYFSHKRHVAAGLECQGCHGPVETMTRVERIPKLTMGWCVNCHEQRHAPLECSTCHD